MEAAQKGRTQLCALLLAHGADPFMKNQEGQTSLDLATAEDVKCLLQDSMLASQQNISTTTKKAPDTCTSPNTEVVLLPTGASLLLPIPVPPLPLRSCLSPAQGAESHYDALEDDKFAQDTMSPTLASFLTTLQLEHLIEMFEREQITLEILAEMGHEDLKQVGVTAYGFRHKILKGIATLRSTTGMKFLESLFTIFNYVNFL